MGWIILILWLMFSTLAIIEYASFCKDLKVSEQIIVSIIFLIGGPIFAAANILETILDCILPEGWNDDDNDRFY